MKKNQSYQELQTNKKHLKVFGFIILLLSIGAIVGSVFLFINFSTKLAISETVSAVLSIIFGIILALLGLVGLFFSIIALFVSAGMINTKGSVKDGNRAIGTENAKLCSKCGRQLGDNDAFCKTCGEPAEDKMKCKNCGAIISKEAQFCVKCGKTEGLCGFSTFYYSFRYR